MSSVCLVAGDPSGDAHGAHLVEALRRLDPSLTVHALGGPKLHAAGAHLLEDLTQTAAIGPFDAARHLGRFARARAAFAKHLAAHRPDAVVLIDFGDYNLPVIAPLAKRAGCRVLYYISPQLWAWGRFRLRWVRRYVDRMIVLFRFEETFYRNAGVPVTWVGHPLVDTAVATVDKETAAKQFGINPLRMTVGLLPGSRLGEVARHVPILLGAAKHIAWQMPGVQFLLLKAPQLPSAMFARVARASDIIVSENRMYDGLQAMDAAVVSSGTSTLETALFEVPMAVVYRTSWPTYLAAKSVVRIPHIAMVNVIAGREVVPEFVQHRASPRRIATAVVQLLRDKTRRALMQAELRAVKEQLGPPGAVARAAAVVLEELRKAL